MNRSVWRWSAGALLFGLSGCPQTPPPILFHSDAGQHALAPVDAGPAPDAAHPADAGHAEALLSNAVPGDGLSLTLDGVTVRANPGEKFTRYVALDPDGDGDRDVALLRTGANDVPVGLGFYRRDPAGFVPVQIAGGDSPTDPHCTDASLRSTSPHAVVVTYRCPPAVVPAGGGAPAVAAPFTAEHVVVALAPTAQVRLRISELPMLAGTVIDTVVETADRDGDGRDDIVATVGARGVADRPDSAVHASVVWLDRPAGVARDTTEPDASFAHVVAQARNQTNRRGLAIGTIERLVRLRRVLCAEAGAPRVRFGSENGVGCANSAALRGVPDVWARALLTAGEVPAAIAATRPETAIEFGVANPVRLRADLRRALLAQTGVVARRGPFAPASLEAGTVPRATALSFDPPAVPNAVLLHTEPPMRLDLTTLAIAPADPSVGTDARLRAADGSRAFAGFFETCDGVVAAVCPSAAPDCMTAPSRADQLPPGAESWRVTDLIAPEHAATCLREGAANVPAMRASQTRALGFARDALLVMHRGRVLRVAAGGATVTPIGATTSLGGPFAPLSNASATGAYLAVPSADGVLVRSDDGHWHLWSDPLMIGRYPQLTDLTISDDGRTLVGLMGTQIWVMQHDVMQLAPPTITPGTNPAPAPAPAPVPPPPAVPEAAPAP